MGYGSLGLCHSICVPPFERVMEQLIILRGITFENLFSLFWCDYFFGENFEEMIENLKKVFLRMQEVNVKINPKKYVLFGR